jgi:hypothetical protein
VTLRRARREDVPAIVGLLAEDEIAGGRENVERPLDDGYWSAYEEISRDDRSVLIVAEVDVLPSRGSATSCSRGRLNECMSLRMSTTSASASTIARQFRRVST